MRPRPSALAASLGTAACATSCVTRTKRSEAPSSSRSTRATSAVRPEGPGAAPLRARWRFESTNSGGGPGQVGNPTPRGKAPHTARLGAGRDHGAPAKSRGCLGPARYRRQRLSCRGQFSKVHKVACALGGTGREGFRGRYLGSGHRWLKWLGFFQELGPPPLIKRREACNPLMLGQLPNTRAAMQQHAWHGFLAWIAPRGLPRRGWLTKQRPGRDARDRGQKGERTGKCKHGAGESGANPLSQVAPAPAGAADPPPAAAWGREVMARCRSG